MPTLRIAQGRAHVHHRTSKYDFTECSAGFHVYNKGSMEGDECCCGESNLGANKRAFIKGGAYDSSATGSIR